MTQFSLPPLTRDAAPLPLKPLIGVLRFARTGEHPLDLSVVAPWYFRPCSYYSVLRYLPDTLEKTSENPYHSTIFNAASMVDVTGHSVLSPSPSPQPPPDSRGLSLGQLFFALGS